MGHTFEPQITFELEQPFSSYSWLKCQKVQKWPSIKTIWLPFREAIIGDFFFVVTFQLFFFKLAPSVVVLQTFPIETGGFA